MTTYYIRQNDRQQVRTLRTAKGSVEPVTLDFSPWAEDNGNVTTVTWTVDSGNAAVSGEALTSNVASAVVTTADAGQSMLIVKGTGATHAKPIYVRVVARDPGVLVYDYGWRT